MRRDDGGLTVIIVLDRKRASTLRRLLRDKWHTAPWDNCACQPYCFELRTRSPVDPRHRARIHDERPRFSHPSRGRFSLQTVNTKADERGRRASGPCRSITLPIHVASLIG